MFAKTERTVVRETVLDFFSFMVYIVIFVHSFLSDTDLFKTECGTLDELLKILCPEFFFCSFYIYIFNQRIIAIIFRFNMKVQVF